MIPENIHLTASQKRLVKQWISEISIKKGEDEKQIIANILKDNFFANPSHDRKSKGKYFFDILYKKRYPEYSRALLEFKRLENSFFDGFSELRNSIKIKPSKYFEKEEIMLTLNITPDNINKIKDLMNNKSEVLKKMALLI